MSYAQPFPLARPAALDRATFGPDLAVRLICTDCKDPNPNIVEEFSSGDLVCGNCGLVLGNRVVDTRSEWRTFANDEGDDPSRVGAASDPLMDGAEQLDTIISHRDGGSGIARELQRAATRSVAGRAERTLLSAFRDITSICSSNDLSKTIIDTTKQLYKRVDEEKLLRGKPVNAVIAACIFIACRQNHVPRTFKEICSMTKVSKKTIGQCYKVIEQAFNLGQKVEGRGSDRGAMMTPKTDPESLLARYCNHLDLPPNYQRICSDIIGLARDQGIAAGRSPVSIAGGAIYFVCHLMGNPKSSRDIASVAGTSAGTIKLVYRLYFQDRDKIVPSEILESGKGDLARLPNDLSK